VGDDSPARVLAPPQETSMSKPSPRSSDERGIVLVAAVMFMVLTAVLAAAFMATSTGERQLSSNTHIAKGALYSADAGVRVAQQILANLGQTKVDSLVNLWSGNGPIIAHPDQLFPAGAIPASATSPTFDASATISFSDSDLTDTSQVYNFKYTTVSSGRFGFLGQRRVQSEGILRVSASRGSFADYLVFTNTHLLPGGSAIWFSSSVSFDGRVHTNGEFRFAYRPTFQDLVSSVNNRAWYYNGGSPRELAANNNGTIDVPAFFGGFQRSAQSVTLPPNSFSQQNAALGLSPGSSTAPSNATINTQLGTSNGSSPPPTGVYLVHSGTAVTGGIYVQGDLAQGLMKIDTTTSRQVYRFTQGGTITTVQVDRATNQTLVTVGGTTTTYTGVPRGVIYDNGSINDLRGPDRVAGTPPPAIQTGTQLLVAATGDIVIQRDIALDDYNSATNVLGLYSSTGNVRIGTSAPSEMQLDAFVMSTGTNGVFTVDNYDSGAPRGTFHLRGGMVSTYYGAFYTFDTNGVLLTGYARDFHFDRRGLVPPYFPTTGRFTGDQPVAHTLVWKEL
jgi:Tfp pilus assembly protein PilX